MLEITTHLPRPELEKLLCMRLSGRMDAEGAPLFEQALQKLEGEELCLILDLEALEYLSSAGLGGLLLANKFVEDRGGKLVLCGPTHFVRQVMELSGMAKVLRLAETMDQALDRCGSSLAAPWSRDTEKGRLAFTPRKGSDAALELWEEPSREAMLQASLAELGICMGIGGFGTRREQALENKGLFFCGFNVAALLPDGSLGQPLLLTTRYPSETVLFVARGAGLSGDPLGRLDFKASESVSLAWFLNTLEHHLPDAADSESGEGTGLCATLFFVDELTPSAQDGESAPGAVLLCLHYSGSRNTALPPALASLPWRRDGELHCITLALTLREPPTAACEDTPAASLERVCALKHIRSFFEIGPEARFNTVRAWFWRPDSLRSAQEKRLQVVCPEGLELNESWDAIIRAVYAAPQGEGRLPASQVRLVPLRPFMPGRDPALFLVHGLDSHGAPLPPSLLELDAAERIHASHKALHRHARYNLAQNAAIATDFAKHGAQAGLRYELARQDDAEVELFSLAQLYETRPVAELLPIFDRVFTQTLKPWYGHPVWDTVHLWQEHDPLPRYPDILEAAASEQGLDPDDEHFDSPELGRRVLNPFHVLAHEFPKRRQEQSSWYLSVVHGDLNLHNVLLDERHNIHVVNLHAARRGNVVSDFARLEPLLLLEYARLASEEEGDTLARFLETWYAAPNYASPPPFGYAGSDPRVSRAYQVLRRLRVYADVVTLFETDMRPYLLAVLQWTLPAITFPDWEPERKRLATIMGGVLCEQILRSETP